MRSAPRVHLPAGDRAELLRWRSQRGSRSRQAVRAGILLAAASGDTNTEIASHLGVHPATVARWRSRYLMSGLPGLEREAPRAGSSARVPKEAVERILEATLGAHAGGGRAWTTRTLARSLQVSHMLVHRVWKQYGLANDRPRRTAPSGPRTTLVRFVGAYLNPPAAAAVFEVEERSLPSTGAGRLPEIFPNITGHSMFEGFMGSSERLAQGLVEARWERGVFEPARDRGAALTVFLRGVEERSPRDAKLTIVLDRPL